MFFPFKRLSNPLSHWCGNTKKYMYAFTFTKLKNIMYSMRGYQYFRLVICRFLSLFKIIFFFVCLCCCLNILLRKELIYICFIYPSSFNWKNCGKIKNSVSQVFLFYKYLLCLIFVIKYFVIDDAYIFKNFFFFDIRL